jgi:hypothetical protein
MMDVLECLKKGPVSALFCCRNAAASLLETKKYSRISRVAEKKLFTTWHQPAISKRKSRASTLNTTKINPSHCFLRKKLFDHFLHELTNH